jgi:hypothetical protein
VDNKQRFTGSQKDVIHEDVIKVKATINAPDFFSILVANAGSSQGPKAFSGHQREATQLSSMHL